MNKESQSKSFLDIINLSVAYTANGEQIHAVNGVSLSLERGKTIGLVGETGAGKTTIAKAILRILPEMQAQVNTGEIWLDGEELLTATEKEMLKIRGSKVAMIFQDPMTALNPVQRVGNQIAEAVKLHNNVTKEQARERACEMLETVGIPQGRYSEYPHQFSGGMKQRVVIAMALACNPQLLLADEPTTALDVTIQAQVLEMINDLKGKFNTAMILITHDLGIVAQACDSVAIIYAGKIVELGSKQDVFDNPTHPYTKGLFGAIPSLKEDVHRLNPIPGMPPDAASLPAGCPFGPRCTHKTAQCALEIPTTEITAGHYCSCCLLSR